MYFVVAGELVVYSPQDRPPAKIDARLENLKKKKIKQINKLFQHVSKFQ